MQAVPGGRAPGQGVDTDQVYRTAAGIDLDGEVLADKSGGREGPTTQGDTSLMDRRC